MFDNYDLIVAGAGHAGCEAASAAANMGSKVLLITMNLQTIAQMSCNPAMGGIAKGQIVREIDAMGGFSGIVSDKSMIQFRMLNKSKGPAMWSPRTQNDRMLFSSTWREILEENKNIDFYQDTVKSIIIDKNKASGVITNMGHHIKAKAVIITSGTFLNGIIHIGDKNFAGGRVGEKASHGITEQLVSLGFESDRLKTGTPPRVDGRSLDYSKMEMQFGDTEISGFSFLPIKKIQAKDQKCCFITYTSENTHEVLKKGFDRSPMFTGKIEGTGPRYCPSIEDKINRFADKNRHQLFIEPEGWNTVEIYVNGFSTSLPEEIQYEALRTIDGFHNVKLFRPGYAIEYDFFPPTQLKQTLETKSIENLFFAGQINGTTGYEEAACQGLIAGMNAHLTIKNEQPIILKRDEAYIGVLIDDLVNKGTKEPYRMFTSRAEFRTLLRQDNADLRLTEMSFNIGLASRERLEMVEKKKSDVEEILKVLKNTSAEPTEINTILLNKDSSPLLEKQRLSKILLRPNIGLAELSEGLPLLADTLEQYEKPAQEQAEIQLKYERYIEKEKELAIRMNKLEEMVIPKDFQFNKIIALSNEARQKFAQIQPRTLGQASRISGVNPSDVHILMIYMGR